MASRQQRLERDIGVARREEGGAFDTERTGEPLDERRVRGVGDDPADLGEELRPGCGAGRLHAGPVGHHPDGQPRQLLHVGLARQPAASPHRRDGDAEPIPQFERRQALPLDRDSERVVGNRERSAGRHDDAVGGQEPVRGALVLVQLGERRNEVAEQPHHGVGTGMEPARPREAEDAGEPLAGCVLGYDGEPRLRIVEPLHRADGWEGSVLEIAEGVDAVAQDRLEPVGLREVAVEAEQLEARARGVEQQEPIAEAVAEALGVPRDDTGGGRVGRRSLGD